MSPDHKDVSQQRLESDKEGAGKQASGNLSEVEYIPDETVNSAGSRAVEDAE